MLIVLPGVDLLFFGRPILFWSTYSFLVDLFFFLLAFGLNISVCSGSLFSSNLSLSLYTPPPPILPYKDDDDDVAHFITTVSIEEASLSECIYLSGNVLVKVQHPSRT